MRHKYKILTYQNRKVHIDKEIAPLLSGLWKLGIKTNNSCQSVCSFNCEHKIKIQSNKYGGTYCSPIKTEYCLKHIWICFDAAKDIESFFNAVAEYVPIEKEEGTMYAHIRGHDGNKYPHDIWSIEWFADNFGVNGHWGRPMFNGKRSTQEMWIEDSCHKNNFIMSPQLTFPQKHLSYVEKRIQLALKGKINVV